MHLPEDSGVRRKVYSITSRGFELLSEAGYILRSPRRSIEDDG